MTNVRRSDGFDRGQELVFPEAQIEPTAELEEHGGISELKQSVVGSESHVTGTAQIG